MASNTSYQSELCKYFLNHRRMKWTADRCVCYSCCCIHLSWKCMLRIKVLNQQKIYIHIYSTCAQCFKSRATYLWPPSNGLPFFSFSPRPHYVKLFCIASFWLNLFTEAENWSHYHFFVNNATHQFTHDAPHWYNFGTKLISLRGLTFVNWTSQICVTNTSVILLTLLI